MNYDALHKLTLDSSNAESSVTVNQRALIDKVLARYSSENTLLRELLQNSDDANATTVKIIYESVARPENDINKRITKRVIVKNNGQIFRAEDWSRLSRIAEGNPDEAKIGAFGVGFYSVFSICEDPFVTSGDTGLAFYWRNDQLFTRTAKLPIKDEWTSFALNMRQEMEIPGLKTLTRFLTTALTFSRSLTHIDLYLDDLNLCSIKKVVSPGTSISIPSHLSTVTSGKVFKITGAESSSVQITATYLNATQVAPSQSVQSKFFSFFSKEDAKQENSSGTSTSAIFLRVVTGTMSSSLKSSFAAELQRATKKPAPKTTKVQIVTVNAAEHAASTSNASIFQDLSTFPDQGRVYIGFPTHQTTGFCGHVGAPCLIPTVERESIDLVDRYIKVWNFEVLRAIGFLARISYHTEFAHIKSNDEAIHTMKFFSMRSATPQRIDQTIEESFFASSNALSVLSEIGIRPSTDTRLPDKRIGFLRSTPILPVEIEIGASAFIDKLIKLGYIEHISIGDIKADISSRVLSTQDGIQFLRYCADIAHTIDKAALSTLLRAGIIDAGNEHHFNADDVKHYSNAKVIPSSSPLPHQCLPSSIASALPIECFKELAWSELLLIDWLDFVANRAPIGKADKDINADSEFATLVLAAVSKSYDALFSEDRERALNILRNRTCMPTKSHGMKKPDQTYFNTIKMFDDLPLVLSMKGVKEKFLAALGVRKTVELDLIFDRLLKGGSWTTIDVISYLASVKRDIPAKDIERLKGTPLAAAEGSEVKQRVDDLYEPNITLRQLGLPIIAWKGPWRAYSEEAVLLYTLGLRKFPPPKVLIELAAVSDKKEQALAYFLQHFVSNGYASAYEAAKVKHAFIPTMSGKLARPTEVYSEPSCAIFGFEVVRKDLLDKARLLGIQTTPSTDIIINIITRKPPQSHAAAVLQFSLLQRLQPVFSKEDRITLGARPILPIEQDGKLLRMASPDKCFFKTNTVDPLFMDIFDFIDFGPQANHILRAVGVRDHPSTQQLAGMLVNDARNVWTLCRNEARYQQLLLQIARNFEDVKRDRHLLNSMRNGKILLAYRFMSAKENVVQTSLQRASDTIIIDDMIAFNLFKTEIYASPESALIEEMYAELGAPRLSMIVLDRPIISGRPASTPEMTKLKADLIERLTIFVSDPSIRAKRDIKWLTTNLVVQQVDHVAIQRTLMINEQKISRQSATTAIIENNTLIVSPSPDRYDIAVAVCKYLLTSSKQGDHLLLESLLTKSLETLKTRGYNVDRILQKQEKERQERRIAQEAEHAKAIKEQEQFAEQQAIQAPAAKNIMPGAFPETKGLLSSWKKAIRSAPTPVIPLPQQITAGQSPDPVTSQAQIEKTIQSAIKATRSTDSKNVQSLPSKNTVSEAATYCDTKPAQNLSLCATLPNGTPFFVDNALNATQILGQYETDITSFNTLLDQLKSVFSIHDGLCIFYDTNGGTIAFNQSRTIFCNLRFFISLKLNKNDAMVYWFTTLAHEFAHNLVSEHSSEHEFYMESIICAYFAKLASLIA